MKGGPRDHAGRAQVDSFLGLLGGAGIEVFLTGDEESPGHPLDAGHSSRIFSPAEGHGAIFEISRIIGQFHEQLQEPNLTLNVGLLLGGSGIEATADGQTKTELRFEAGAYPPQPC